jgi:hypothetical protein
MPHRYGYGQAPYPQPPQPASPPDGRAVPGGGNRTTVITALSVVIALVALVLLVLLVS